MKDWNYFMELDHQLCFAIYACSREINRLYRPYLDELNLTYPQFLVLVVLWENKRLTVKEMGVRLHLDSGTLTPMLKRMEAMELVKRVRGTTDERKVFIELTDKAEHLKAEADSLPETCIPHFGLNFDQYQHLLNEIKELTKNLQLATSLNTTGSDTKNKKP